MKRKATRVSDARLRVRDRVPSKQDEEDFDRNVFESELLRALNQVESAARVSAPNLDQMIRLVEETKRRQSRAFRRDLVLFIIAAAFVGFGWIISAACNVLVDVLVVTSFVSIAIIPIVWVLDRRKVVSS